MASEDEAKSDKSGDQEHDKGPEPDPQRVIELVKALLLILGLLAIPLSFWRFTTAPTEGWAPYWICAAIGVSVGMTELIARYRDAPFAPLLTVREFLFRHQRRRRLAGLSLHRGDPDSDRERDRPNTDRGISAMALFRSGI